MRLYILLLVLLVAPVFTQAQNIVPNGNFENYSSCPLAFDETYKCYPWKRYTTASTDYFNACASINLSVPANFAGYQQAASGNGYMGCFSSYNSVFGVTGYSEYLTVPISQMIPGALYEVSMSVSLANPACRGAHNELGIWLFDNSPDTITGTGPLTVKPQIDFTNYGVISDTLNWTRLTKYYTPDSTYDHIVIGQFDSVQGGTHIPVTCGVSGSPTYYYYIDSVVIKAVTGINNLYADSLICIGDTFYVPYTLNGTYAYATGNVFTAILSNASGSFSSGTTVIGSINSITAGSIKCIIPNTVPPGNHYRIRIQSNILGDAANNNSDIIISAYPRPVITTTAALCKGDTLRLTASSVSAIDTFFWNGPNISIKKDTVVIPNVSFNNAGDYILEAKTQRCIAYDTITINVKPLPPLPNISLTVPACIGDTFFMHTDTLATQYFWNGPNNFTSSVKDTFIYAITSNTSGTYKLSITTNGCTISNSQSLTVTPKPSPVITTNSPVCINDTLRLETNETFAGETYNWSGPNNFSNTTRTPTIFNPQSNVSGQYIVTVTNNGCSERDTTDVYIKPLPQKPNALANTRICENDTLHLSANSITTNASYTWNGPNSFTSHQISTSVNNISLNASGQYIITANLDGCIQRDTTDVIVKPLPEKPIINANSPLQTGQDLYLKLDNPQANVKYRWSGPSGFTSVVPNPIIYKPDTNSVGTYFMIAELNGCYNSNQVLVQIDQRADTGNIFLYPIPNNGDFYIKGIFKTDQQMPVHIYDGIGKQVYTNVFKTNNKKLFEPISLRDYLASGEYSFHIITDGKKRIIRFTVIR